CFCLLSFSVPFSYIDTLESTALKFPDKYTTYSTNENRLLIQQMKFEMNVHGIKLKSVEI
ncbi:hypothetical protein EWB00_005745, partial [Schistosoma japonicum]